MAQLPAAAAPYAPTAESRSNTELPVKVVSTVSTGTQNPMGRKIEHLKEALPAPLFEQLWQKGIHQRELNYDLPIFFREKMEFYQEGVHFDQLIPGVSTMDYDEMHETTVEGDVRVTLTHVKIVDYKLFDGALEQFKKYAPAPVTDETDLASVTIHDVTGRFRNNYAHGHVMAVASEEGLKAYYNERFYTQFVKDHRDEFGVKGNDVQAVYTAMWEYISQQQHKPNGKVLYDSIRYDDTTMSPDLGLKVTRQVNMLKSIFHRVVDPILHPHVEN